MNRHSLYALALVSLCAVTAPAAGQSGRQQPRSKPALSPTQQQNLAKLKADLQAIHGKSTVTPEQKQAVKNDLIQIFSGASKPSQDSVSKLAADLTAAVADRKITPAEAYKLSQDVAAVLASANISQQSVNQLKADVQALLRATNITQADLQTIQSDVNAIIDTAKAKARAATTTRPRKKNR